MKHRLNLCMLIAFAALAIAIANGQTTRNANKHFEKDGLSFDYPSAWEITENSSQGVVTVTLKRSGSASRIMVSTQDGFRADCDFQSERKRIAAALIEKVAAQIHADRLQPVATSTQIQGSEIEGVQLQGALERKHVTAEVYSGKLHQHFVSLTGILAQNDERAKSAWNVIRTSLAIKPPVFGAMVVAESDKGITKVGEVRGQASNLPHPEYPKIARSAHASGTVKVQVTISEGGDVIEAHAVSGHPLLLAAAVDAAKRAKFSVTKLCGEPVRVAGILTYVFAAQ